MSRRKQTDYVVIHSTMTPPSKTITVKVVDEWHRKEGWLEVGHHFFIRNDGTLEFGRHPETVGAHTKKHNANSISICLVGGSDSDGKSEDNFSELQKKTLESLLDTLALAYPNAEVVTHSELDETECPSFDLDSWWKTKYNKEDNV